MTSPERAIEAVPEQSFRDVLAAAIEVTAMTREELARRIGRSGAAVSQWLNRGDMPDLAVVFKIEDALDLQLGALVRHHSPDIWLIIEMKVSGNSWTALYWEKKIQEGLIDGPFEAGDRKMILNIAGRLAEYNVTRNARGSR